MNNDERLRGMSDNDLRMAGIKREEMQPDQSNGSETGEESLKAGAPEVREAPTYRISELEQQLDDANARMRGVLGGRPVEAVDNEQFREVKALIDSTNEALKQERLKVTPEDNETLKTLEADREALTARTEESSKLSKRILESQHYSKVDPDEISRLRVEYFAIEKDLRTEARRIAGVERDLISRGLLRSLEAPANEVWRNFRFSKEKRKFGETTWAS